MLDSCGSSGTGETPQAERRGGSPPAPRKASTWSGNQPLLKSKQQQSLRKQTKKDKTMSKQSFVCHFPRNIAIILQLIRLKYLNSKVIK
ncbi:hypothetical protein B1NLA3E_18785 [Bacillus sp. 1NLA3E]|nr:hypothetical protein B1NLA3E_18785 [Bacillus sp. 1NLA3E]